MSWEVIFSITTYLAVAIIVVSIVLRFFKKFRLYVPIIIAILLLISVGGNYAIRVTEMTDAEIIAHFEIAKDDVGMIRGYNNVLLYTAILTVIVVYISCACEGISRGINYLIKKWRNRR